jgi:hypothetical protein
MLIELSLVYLFGASTPGYSQVPKSTLLDGRVSQYKCQQGSMKVRYKLEKRKFVPGVNRPADKSSMSDEDIYRVDFLINDKLGVTMTKPSWLLTSMLAYTSTRTGESEVKTRVQNKDYAKREEVRPGTKFTTPFETVESEDHGKLGKTIKGTSETTIEKGPPTKWKNENLETVLITETERNQTDGSVRKVEHTYAPKISASLKLTRRLNDKIIDECSLTDLKL